MNTPYIGNNALCYEGIQRIFRNTLVSYLRIRMAEVFPSDHSEKLRKPFAKEWDELVRNANASRETGGTETRIRDEYDLLSVAHFFSLFDAYYDKLFSSAALAGKNYPKPSKSKLLGDLKAIKDSRDPLSHPVEEEVSYEEAFGLLRDVKQVLVSLGFTNEAGHVSQLLTQLTGFDSHGAEHLVYSLPTQDSIYLDFVGRREVLANLSDWFSATTNKRCLLAGDGGKGKSAVAYRYAQGLSERTTGYKMIAWLSAKRRRFEEGRMIQIDAPDFTNTESAIDRMLLHYGLMDDINCPIETKKGKLLAYLNDFPAFLVVDDIDTVLSDTDVVNLFTFEIPSTKSTVLLTSRRDIPGIKNFTIKGFELPEAHDFVKSRIELYSLDPACFADSITRELMEVTDGSPLYMDDLLRLTKIVSVEKAISLWSEKKGDEARRYALQRELEQLSTDARKVLIAACITEEPVSFAEIETVLGVSEERILTALTELQTLFLFPKPRVVEGEQRFELNRNTRKLVRLVEGSSDQYARIETASRAIAGNLPDVGRGVISSLIRQAYLLMTNDRHQEAESLLIKASDKYPQASDIQGFMGFFYRKRERYTDATKHFENAYKLKCKHHDTYRHWVKMEMSLKEWTRAIAAADKGLKLLPDCQELHALRGECKVRSGQDLAARLQREKAFKLWNEAAQELAQALKSPPNKSEPENSAAMYKTLFICLDNLGDFRSLKHYFDAWKIAHPDDENIERQLANVERRRGKKLDQLAASKPELQTSSRQKPG
jgi:tetratricopeptide (TPR) repeat protein